MRWAELRSQSANHSYAEPCVGRFRLSPTNLRPWIEGVESPLLTVTITRRSEYQRDEVSNHLFRDVKSICQTLFILITSPRRERSAVGRVRRSRRSAQQTTRTCRPAPNGAVRVNFASAHAVRTTSALSLYLLQWCDFKISYMNLRRQGSNLHRNILSRMDLKFSENSINNTVVRTARPEPATVYEAAFLPSRQAANLGSGRSGSSGQSSTGVHRPGSGLRSCFRGRSIVEERAKVQEPISTLGSRPLSQFDDTAASGQAGDEAGGGRVSVARCREAIPHAAFIFALDGGPCRAGFRRGPESRLGDNRLPVPAKVCPGRGERRASPHRQLGLAGPSPQSSQSQEGP